MGLASAEFDATSVPEQPMTGQTMVESVQRRHAPPGRRGFLASLLVMLGLRPAAVTAATPPPPEPVTMVERDGWLLDAKDR